MRNRRPLDEFGAYHAASGPHAGKGPRGYVRDWTSVRDEVCDRLAEDGEVDASDIDVDVTDGIVTLRGTVADRHQKRRAEHIADGVDRVRDVFNELRLAGRARTHGLDVNGTESGAH